MNHLLLISLTLLLACKSSSLEKMQGFCESPGDEKVVKAHQVEALNIALGQLKVDAESSLLDGQHVYLGEKYDARLFVKGKCLDVSEKCKNCLISLANESWQLCGYSLSGTAKDQAERCVIWWGNNRTEIENK